MSSFYSRLCSVVPKPILADTVCGDKICVPTKCVGFSVDTWYENGVEVNGPDGWHKREYDKKGEIRCQYILTDTPGVYIYVDRSGAKHILQACQSY